MSDPHETLGNVGIYSSIVGDGGPRMYRQRGKELPEKYLPGRFLQRMRADARADIMRALQSPPADWWIRLVVSATEDA